MALKTLSIFPFVFSTDRLAPLVEAQLGPGVVQGGAGHIARPFGPGFEYLVQLSRVIQQLQGSSPYRGKALHYHLSEVLFKVSVALALVLFFDLDNRAASQPGVDVEQVRKRGLVGGCHYLGAGVGFGAADLAAYHVRLVEERDVPGGRRRALAHLLRGLVECHDPRSGLQNHGLRNNEGLTVESVETPCERPRELQVLALVLAHGDELRVVEEDVGGLEHGVVVEPDARALGATPLGLVLKLRHARKLADPRYTVQ